MKAALRRHIGVRREAAADVEEHRWDSIADSYLRLYEAPAERRDR
jgi:hypothetical protein